MITSYQFEILATRDRSKDLILSCAKKCKAKKLRTSGDEIKFKMAPGFMSFKLNFCIFLFEKGEATTVGITVKGHDNARFHLKTYDKFLSALIDSGAILSVVAGTPRIVSATMIGDGTEIHFVNRFGGVATDMRTARTKTVLSKKVHFQIVYSNGMVEEKEVKRNSKQFVELMAKLSTK